MVLWLVALGILDLVWLALWLHYRHPGRVRALFANLWRHLRTVLPAVRGAEGHRTNNRRAKSAHSSRDASSAADLGSAREPSPPRAPAETATSLSEAVDQLLKLCLRTVPAEAAVVLLPRQNLWCVAGGVSLGDRERMLRLDPDNWLLNQVAVARHGVIIEKTDSFRAQLAATPLAHWRTLLAVSVPSVDGLLVLARAKEPFTTKELKTLAKTTAARSGILTKAVHSARTIDLTGPRHLIDPS